MKYAFILLFFPLWIMAQPGAKGSLEASFLNKSNALSIEGATIQLTGSGPNSVPLSRVSGRNGRVYIDSIPFGFYRLSVTMMGFTAFRMDSIHFHPENEHIFLGEIMMEQRPGDLETVVVYAEKPLIQVKDGNLTMNVAESPLSAGSNAGDLLKNIPLVATDPDGKVTVRGREPRILIDEKPVELNGQQLSDFLESLPGGMIEKIEVMTNPPPQYANEPGGVINIVTKKGKSGLNGRISLFAGSRGEAGANGSLSYRKKGLAINFVIGGTYNEYQGNGYGYRQNQYPDSSNALQTTNRYKNITRRPNSRFSLDYDLNTRQTINLVLQMNENDFDNNGLTGYENINTNGELYKRSERSIYSTGHNLNPSANITYTYRGRNAGEVFRIVTGYNTSWQANDRYFVQQFYDAFNHPTGPDSVQWQLGDTRNQGGNARISYDKPFNEQKTILSFGSAYLQNRSNVILNSYYEQPTGEIINSERLSNDLLFRQQVFNFRASARQKLGRRYHVSAGIAWEKTDILFELYNIKQTAANNYINWLPFGTFSGNFENGKTLSLSYRKAIRRPGIRELNPSVDYTDPYNIRFGNPALLPSLSHNIDLVFGKNNKQFSVNFGLGYNIVDDIFTNVRTLVEDGKTTITWENISARKEYEASSWLNYRFNSKLRTGLSLGYVFNQYSAYDIDVNNYRNGGSLNANINISYAPASVWNITGYMHVNRFANPQGTVRSTMSMNVGVQRKLLSKKLLITLNAIDPIMQQRYDILTVGTNFTVKSTGLRETRNFRLTMTYLFQKKV